MNEFKIYAYVWTKNVDWSLNAPPTLVRPLHLTAPPSEGQFMAWEDPAHGKIQVRVKRVVIRFNPVMHRSDSPVFLEINRIEVQCLELFEEYV